MEKARLSSGDAGEARCSCVSYSTVVRRRFVVLLSRPPPACRCAVNVDALHGGCRLDVACRCVSAALFLSERTRLDCEILLVFAPDDDDDVWTVRVHGATCRHLRADERTCAHVLLAALFPEACAMKTRIRKSRACPAGGIVEARCAPLNAQDHDAPWEGPRKCCKGVNVARADSLEALLRSCADDARGGELLVLRPDGPTSAAAKVAAQTPGPGPRTFVLGDDRGFSAAAEAALNRERTAAVNLITGGRVLLASHCVVLLNGCLDALDEPEDPV